MKKSVKMEKLGVIFKLTFVSVALLTLSGYVFAATINLNIKDMPVKEVISNLTSQSGVNVIMASDAGMDRKISLTLHDYDLEKALDMIAMASGLNYKKMDDGTYIFGGNVQGNDTLISPDTLIGSISKPDTEEKNLSASSAIETSTIKLYYSDARELLKVLGCKFPDEAYGVAASHNEAYANKKNIRNYKQNPRLKMADNGQVQKPYNVSPRNDFKYDEEAYGDIANQMGGGSRGGFSGGGSRGGMGGGMGMSGGGMGGMGGGMGMSGGGMGGMGGGMSGGSGGNWGSMLTPQNLIVMPYDLDNSIIVKGTSADIAEMRKLVQDLDIPPAQVEIKAEFIEISVGDVKKFGIDWQIGKIGRQFGTGTTDAPFSPGGNVFFNYATGNLIANLQMQLTETVGKVVNSPIISTVNNYPASINIQQDIPYFTYDNTMDNGTVISTYSVEDVTVSSYLDVTPRINADNSITLYIDTQIEEVVEFVPDPEGGTVPSTLSQDLISIRRIYDRDTVVVGGFVRTHNSTTVNKVPFLGDLPIIGGLFKTLSRSVDERELLIFITPRIIPDTPNMNKAGLTEI